MVRGILKYSGRTKVLTFLATFLVLIAVASGIMPFVSVYKIITPLIQGEKITKGFAFHQLGDIVFFLFLNFILYILALSLSHIAAYNTLFNLRKSLQERTEKLPLGVILDRGVGKTKKLFVDDVESIEILLAHAIPEGIGNALIPIAVFIAMFIFDWRLALLTVATVPIGLSGMVMMSKSGFAKMEVYYSSAQVMNNTIIEYVNGMEVVKVFNKDEDSYKQYRKNVLAYRDFSLDWYKACFPWMAIYASFLTCTILFTLPFGGMLVLKGVSSLPNLILTLCLSFGLYIPIFKAIRLIPYISIVSRKIKEVEDTLDCPPLKYLQKPFSGRGNEVEFCNVVFAYEDKDVIENVDIVAKEGAKTAFVGESGSGKSTLAKLLVHYYDVKSGKITLGGVDITEFSLEELNKHISFVSQDNFLFNTTIYENIKAGKPDASDAEIMAAAEKAQCNEFIDKLEYGIFSNVGEIGSRLSGGERQRVVLARALLKNVPVVVLDEATVFADPENEMKIEKAISELVKNKTLIVIAHRIPSIQDSDCIYVLERGKVVGSGTHEELLASSSIYRQLYRTSEENMAWSVLDKREDM